MEEIAEFGEFIGGHYEVSDFVASLIVEDVVCDLDFAFVGGIGALGMNRFGKFVGDIAGRERDIKDIVLASSLMEFNRVFSRLSRQQS